MALVAGTEEKALASPHDGRRFTLLMLLLPLLGGAAAEGAEPRPRGEDERAKKGAFLPGLREPSTAATLPATIPSVSVAVGSDE